METQGQSQSSSQDIIPISTHISEIYNCTPEVLENVHMPRYQELTNRFQKMYGEKPKFIARAPGRVNLIGEHIDYSGYGVLPMALEQDTLIALLPTKEPEIQINHILPTLYPPTTLPSDPYQKLKDDKSYVNYFLAGYKAGLADTNLNEYAGIKLLIAGNLPTQAGLSSSASFIVAVGLMAMAANNIVGKLNRTAFIENCIKFERAIGTACGGMDQTISVLGVKGSALYIEFDPIKSTRVKLPAGYCFVVANSLTPSPKLLTLGTRYNKRVVECRFALHMLLKELQIPHKTDLKNLKQLQEFLNYSYEDMINLVDQHIKKEPFKMKDLEAVFGEDQVMKKIVDIPYADVVLNSNHEFFVHSRAVHVFGEAARVIKFRDICAQELPDEEKAKKLGELMNDSHKSCRDLYDCSSEELDLLTGLALKGGAVGSRLTGAGWGGCCVSLVKESDSQEFIQDIIQKYYLNKENKLAITDDLDMYIFSSYPAFGATVLDPQYEVWF